MGRLIADIIRFLFHLPEFIMLIVLYIIALPFVLIETLYIWVEKNSDESIIEKIINRL